jgi:hypothetical protein
VQFRRGFGDRIGVARRNVENKCMCCVQDIIFDVMHALNVRAWQLVHHNELIQREKTIQQRHQGVE